MGSWIRFFIGGNIWIRVLRLNGILIIDDEGGFFRMKKEYVWKGEGDKWYRGFVEVGEGGEVIEVGGFRLWNVLYVMLRSGDIVVGDG